MNTLKQQFIEENKETLSKNEWIEKPFLFLQKYNKWLEKKVIENE